MITIYHLNNSRSERIVWLMEELGLPYELQTFMREPSQLAPATYRAIHPLGRAPAIRDGDLTLIESGAIVEYISTRYGNGRLQVAPSSDNYGRYLQWLHFAEGSLMSNLLLEYIGNLLQADPANPTPLFTKLSGRNVELLSYINTELGRDHYFAGAEFSAADIMMEFVFAFLERVRGETYATYPNIAAWRQRVRARPAYIKAMAVAGPQALGKV